MQLLRATEPLLEKFTYAAILTTEKGEHGEHILLGIEGSKDFDHWEAMLPTFYKLEKLPVAAKEFVAAGGYWHVATGGILSVSIPKAYPATIDGLTLSWGIIPSSSGRDE